MGKELEPEILAGTWAGYCRTVPILEVIKEMGISLSEYIHLRPRQRFEILTPEPQIVDETIQRGNLRTLFPSRARLYRIFGRFPSVEEIQYELTSSGFVKDVASEDISDWLSQAELFFELFRPELEEEAIIRWRIARSFKQELERDEFINEAHVAMREAFTFHFDWSDPDASPRNYIEAYVKKWLIGFSIWYAKYKTYAAGFDDELSVRLYRDLAEDVEAIAERDFAQLEAWQLISSAFPQMSEDERVMIAYLVGRGEKKNIGVSKRSEFETLKRRALNSLASHLGVSELNPDVFDITKSDLGKPESYLTHRLPYSLKRPPFVKRGRSVFEELSLSEVFLVIAKLSVVDQFLVLTYLGYLPFEGQDKLARELGYATAGSLWESKNISYLTERLIAAKLSVQAAQELLEVKLSEILTDINEARESGELRKTKGQIKARRRNPSQEYLATVDLSDPMSREVFDRLLPSHQKIFHLAIERDLDGRFVCSISDLARKLEVSPYTLLDIVKNMAEKFRKKTLVRSSQLRQRAERLHEHPRFSLCLDLLTPKQREELFLFLGISLSGEQLFPLDPPDIAIASRESVSRIVVYHRLRRAVKRLEQELEDVYFRQ